MKLSRPTRIVAAVIAVFSLLFTQFALASYVCPGMAAPESSTITAANAGMPGMANCMGMGRDMAQQSLCHAHGHTGQQSLDKPDLPQIPPFAAVGLVLVLQPADPAVPAAAPVAGMVSLAHATAPPVAIRHCCFRI